MKTKKEIVKARRKLRDLYEKQTKELYEINLKIDTYLQVLEENAE